MTRVLFLGDTAGTGFGTVTRDLASALVRAGSDVQVVSMNEDAQLRLDPDYPPELRDRTILLGHPDGWVGLGAMTPDGQADRDALINRAMGIFTGHTVPGWQPDVALVVGDVASVELSPWIKWLPPTLPALNYVPIEGIDLPPLWRRVWDRVRPVGMCQFGADQIAKVMGHDVPWVYHGVDPDAFWPVSGKRPLVMRTRKGLVTLRSRAECRAFLGWPKDATILFRADRHMPRKNYAAMLRAVAPVLARHPSTLMVWHCRTFDQGGSLEAEVSKYPPFLQQRMASTGLHDKMGGAPRPLLCAMYNAADVYLSTSAEGFGLTIAEAMACGVPAVGMDYSSVTEVIGDGGLLAPVNHLVDNEYDHAWAAVDEVQFGQQVAKLLDDEPLRQGIGRQARRHVVASFSWGKAAFQFSALIRDHTVLEVAA